MEITSTALVSLACLLSSGKTDPQATQDFVKNLTEEQVAVVQQIVNSGACLPKSFANKIQPGAGNKNVESPTTDLTVR